MVPPLLHDTKEGRVSTEVWGKGIQHFPLHHTYTNTCWNRRQGDPEGDPGEDDQQAGGDVGLQDKVQDAPLQLEVEDQPRVSSLEEKR